MKWLFLDLETENWSDDVVGGFGNVPGFGVSLGGVIEITDGAEKRWLYSAHRWVNSQPLGCDWLTHAQLQSKLDKSDLIVTFNGESFDFVLLRSLGFDVYPDTHPSYDILSHFHKSAGHRISLHDLSMGMFLDGKSGSPKEAVHGYQCAKLLWKCEQHIGFIREGFKMGTDNGFYHTGCRFLLRAIADYCLKDVSLTRDLFYSILMKDGELHYVGKFDGQPKTVQMPLPGGTDAAWNLETMITF